MIDLLDMLGLYEGDIEHAWEECSDTLEEQGLGNQIDELEDRLQNSIGAIDFSDATNSLIEIMMSECKNIITEAHPGQEVRYYVNGYDSHIYPGINPESAEGRLNKVGLTQDEIKEILGDEGFTHDIKELFEQGGDIVVYENKAECGADNKDDDRRTEDCTDETFCDFLEDNYINNYVDVQDLCIILESGRVIQASI